MRILILYRHFWPDSPPYASMLRSIARRLVADGQEVTIWTQEPSYKPSDLARTAPRREKLDGIAVERFATFPGHKKLGLVRLLDKLAFPLRLWTKAVWRRLHGERYDLVWTATIPPVAQGMVGRWIAGLYSAKFLYHCQDLYPELGSHMEIWPTEGIVYRILAQIERRTRARADILVTLSDDMAATACALGQPRKLAIINNFALEDFSPQTTGIDKPGAAPELRNDRRVQLIFAGNLGVFQGLDAVVEAMRLVERDCPLLELVLMGEGKALPGLKERAAGLSNVRFEPHRPYEEAQALIAGADIGLVTLEPEIHRYAFPSKTLTYLELGVPIFAIVDQDSELCEQIQKHRLGWVAGARGARAIADRLKEIAQNWNALEFGHVDRARLKQSVSRTSVLTRWRELIVEISG